MNFTPIAVCMPIVESLVANWLYDKFTHTNTAEIKEFKSSIHITFMSLSVDCEKHIKYNSPKTL